MPRDKEFCRNLEPELLGSVKKGLINDIEDDGGGVKRKSSGGSWEKQVLNQTNISQLVIIYE
jgi:hypothetical protein